MNETLKTIVSWFVWPAVVGFGVYYFSRHTLDDCLENIKGKTETKVFVEQYRSQQEVFKKINNLADYIKDQQIKGLQTIYAKTPFPAGLARPEEIKLEYSVGKDYQFMALSNKQTNEVYIIRSDPFFGERSLSLVKSEKIKDLLGEAEKIEIPPKIEKKTK